MKANGYDRYGEICKTRIHTLTSAYRNYVDQRRNCTGTAPSKKPLCFDLLDQILSHKPTTFPTHLKSSSGRDVTEFSDCPYGNTDVGFMYHRLGNCNMQCQ